MNLDKLTVKAQDALQAAQQLALDRSHQQLDGEHLLLALAEQDGGLVPQLLEKVGARSGALTAELDAELNRRARVQGASQVYPTPDLQQALAAATAEARKLKDDFVSTEHLLLGLLQKGGTSLQKLLGRHGLTRDVILKALADLRGNQRVTDQNPEDKFQALEKYGKDLTALAREGKIDPVIGRDDE
ncbi:MAG: Clp protease N-terminal domain-containing protein, partial [Verrucomicrobiota bacterium]